LDVYLNIRRVPQGALQATIIDASTGRHLAQFFADRQQDLENLIGQAWILIAASRRGSGQVWTGLTEEEATSLRLLLAGHVTPL
jgi:hypothetical protein